MGRKLALITAFIAAISYNLANLSYIIEDLENGYINLYELHA